MVYALGRLAARLASLSPAEHGFVHLDLGRRPTGSGRLDGWVIPAKDLYDVAGMPTTFGSVWRTRQATRTDPFLARLEAQGALIPGKSAVPELGLTIHTEPVGLPAPENPLYPGCTPGGSSGGAAVMVARGLVRAAHASDGGGSIRVPAAATGLVGFSPSHAGLSAQGFLTHSVADSAFLHGLVPEHRHVRVGVLSEPLFAPVEVAEDWLGGVAGAAARLIDAGHRVVPVRPWGQAAETFAAFTDLFTAKLAPLPEAEGLAAWLRERGREVTSARWAAARSHAAALPGLLHDFWEVDVLLTPTLSADPPRIGWLAEQEPADNFRSQTEWSPWASLFNVAGTGAVSVPWPRPGRPPTAVQLGSITVPDEVLLRLAEELSDAH